MEKYKFTLSVDQVRARDGDIIRFLSSNIVNSHILVQGEIMTPVNEAEAGQWSVKRVVLHCQCHHLRAAKPALTASLRKHPGVKHLKQIINSLIKLAQTKEVSPAVSFNHSYIKVWGLLVDGRFCKSTSWHYHKTVTEEKLRENFFLR